MTKELCVALVFAASALALLALWGWKYYCGTAAWNKTRGHSYAPVMQWVSTAGVACFITLITADWIAIALAPIEGIDYNLAQYIGFACLGLIFFSAFFVIALFNKPTRLRAILALGSTSILLGFLFLLHNWGWIH